MDKISKYDIIGVTASIVLNMRH